MAKQRLDIYLDMQVFLKLLEYAARNHYKTLSQAANAAMSRAFVDLDEHNLAIDRLNKVIQEKEHKILNLEHELRLKK